MNIRQFYVLIFTFLLTNIFGTNLVFADTTYNNAFQLQAEAINNGGYIRLTKSGSPYFFPNSLQIEANITVDVDPGVVINMGDRSMSIQNGTINFNGTPDDPININSQRAICSWLGAVYPGQAPTVNYKYVNFNNCSTGMVISKKVTSLIENVNFNNVSDFNIYINAGSKTTIKNIQDNYDLGNPQHDTIFISVFDTYSALDPVLLNVSDSNFYKSKNNKIHIADYTLGNFQSDSAIIKFNNNNFYGFTPSSILENSPFVVWDEYNRFKSNSFVPVNATNNYWGTDAGPYHAGGTPTNGPQLPTNIVYDPYLTRDPNSVKECCSSILFIPGIEGSRLYKDRPLAGSDQLWEANINSDLSDLYLDQNGESVNQGVYTGDIIDRTNLVPDSVEEIIGNYDKDIYKNIINYINSQKNNNTIKSSAIYSYDWRLNFDIIINNGTKLQNNTTSKLIDILRQQAKLSDTGKVTIIAHSMGGLLTKRFIQTLDPADQDLIDKVVFIAVPQIGTPEGSSGVLSGIEFEGIFGSLLVKQKYTRAMAENMITAHALSPSNKYFEKVSTAPIKFNSNLSQLLPQVSTYGTEINTTQELQNFMSGNDGRPDAEFSNVNYPNVSPVGFVNKAKNVHDQIDNYEIPSNIKVYQITGNGRPTTKQIEFLENKNKVTYRTFKSFGGDGTVTRESSSYLNSPTYYVNLNKYNKDTNSNYEHKDISGIDPVTGILTNIIKNENITTNQYVADTVQNFFTEKLFTLGMHSPVDIHLYDSAMRHTGPVYVDVNGEIVRFIEENIPNTIYEEYGDDKYITGIDDQIYNIKLDGYDMGLFTLDLQRYIGDTTTTYESFNNLPATDLLTSSINISPDSNINSIILDVDNDGDPDYVSKSSGELVNLHEHDCSHKDKDLKNKKEKDKVCKDKKNDKKEKHEKKKKDEKPRKWHSKKD